MFIIFYTEKHVPVPVVHEKKVLHEVEKYVDVPRPYEVIRKVPYEVRGK